jgi:hypothetical protein
MAGNASNLSTIGAPPGWSFVVRYLDPTEILSEVLFGLIMVLTFTLGAGLIVQEGDDATFRMLLGVVSCNVAWGLIDGVMYVLSSLCDRSRKACLIESLKEAASEEDALAMVGSELDHDLEPFTSPQERARLYPAVLKRLLKLTPQRTRVKKEDVYGAIGVFCLVFLSSIPGVAPFLVLQDRFVALRVSNLLLLTILFLVGYRWARATHMNPWIVGSVLLLVALAMVSISMALGG